MLKTDKIAEAEYDLYRAGLGWITANQGVHLQVTSQGKVVADLWPTTGKVIFRPGTGFARATLYDAIKRK